MFICENPVKGGTGPLWLESTNFPRGTNLFWMQTKNKGIYITSKIPKCLVADSTSALCLLLFHWLPLVSCNYYLLATHNNISSTLCLLSHKFCVATHSIQLTLFFSTTTTLLPSLQHFPRFYPHSTPTPFSTQWLCVHSVLRPLCLYTSFSLLNTLEICPTPPFSQLKMMVLFHRGTLWKVVSVVYTLTSQMYFNMDPHDTIVSPWMDLVMVLNTEIELGDFYRTTT